MSASDTIFALASARGRAGVSVIRLSGPEALNVAEVMVGPLPQPRHAFLRSLKDPETGEVIDTGLVLHFEEGSSFTGEPVVELQCHGSPSVIAALLSCLGKFDKCRLAEPGEFTKRALLNGKMDLVEVEGLGDLIDAETEEQRRQANRMMTGELRGKADEWKAKLLKINSLIEASIDFSDEELPEQLLSSLKADISELSETLAKEISGSRGNEIIRNGFTAAIVGKPNVGKSTLMNALAGREVAIASEIAGTTRDVIEVRLDLAGIPVTLLDTAGLHTSDDAIEMIGMKRARDRATEADLRIFLMDHPDEYEALGIVPVQDDITAYSKSDLGPQRDGLNLSAQTGQGLNTLTSKIEEVLSQRVGRSSSLVRQRHVDSVRSARDALLGSLELMANDDYDIELVSERIRESVGHLDQLVGKFNVEAVLGEIFSSFCIGK